MDVNKNLWFPNALEKIHWLTSTLKWEQSRAHIWRVALAFWKVAQCSMQQIACSMCAWEHYLKMKLANTQTINNTHSKQWVVHQECNLYQVLASAVVPCARFSTQSPDCEHKKTQKKILHTMLLLQFSAHNLQPEPVSRFSAKHLEPICFFVVPCGASLAWFVLAQKTKNRWEAG